MRYVYYWYHHMMPKDERKNIEKVLDEKDYFEFLNLYKKYTIQAIKLGEYSEELQSWIPMIFLPNYISCWDGEDYLYDLPVLDKNNFEKITDYDCECG